MRVMELEMRLPEMRLVGWCRAGLSGAVIARLQWRLLGDNEEQNSLLLSSPVRDAQLLSVDAPKNSSFLASLVCLLSVRF